MSDEGQETQVEAPPGVRLNPFMPGTSPVIPEPPQESAEVAPPDEVHGGDGPDLEDLKARRVATEALVDSMSRKLALLESGVDLDHPHGKLFLKALTRSDSWAEAPTAEEIRATATLYEVPMRES